MHFVCAGPRHFQLNKSGSNTVLRSFTRPQTSLLDTIPRAFRLASLSMAPGQSRSVFVGNIPFSKSQTAT